MDSNRDHSLTDYPAFRSLRERVNELEQRVNVGDAGDGATPTSRDGDELSAQVASLERLIAALYVENVQYRHAFAKVTGQDPDALRPYDEAISDALDELVADHDDVSWPSDETGVGSDEGLGPGEFRL